MKKLLQKIKKNLLLLTVIISASMIGQTVISGKVTDENQMGLPGVSVVEKGTVNGVATDFDGNYSLQVSSNNATLSFSYIGYVKQEISVAGKSVINVALQEDLDQLDEIVVVGYGSAKKRDLTGSIIRVDLEKEPERANVSLLQALQGSVPGLNVGINSTVGGSPSISIRGRTSLSGSDQPLIVLDGIIFNGSLNDLNINDVKSIDVLKDASAAAVYGSRSANGVIIVTTKMGTVGKPTISLNVFSGVQNLSPSDATNIMDGDQFMTRLVDYDYQSRQLAAWYRTMPTSADGRPVRPDPTDPEVVRGAARSVEEYENWLAGNEIDWLDEVLRDVAMIKNYDLSVSGKTEGSSYYISGSFVDQEGVEVGDQFKRSTFRANFESNIATWLKFGLNSSYSFVDNSGIKANLEDALEASPWANKYLEDGITYPLDLAGERAQPHPFSNTIGVNDNTRNSVFLAPKLVFSIPKIEGLKYEINYSYFSENRKRFQFYPKETRIGTDRNGQASKLHVFNTSWILNNIISFRRTFNGIHSFDVTLLGSREKRTFGSSSLTGTDFSIPSLGYEGIGLSLIQSVNSGAEEENNIAYMGRLNYKLKNRYLFTGTVRQDGFSGFAKGNKTAVFPSAAFGWIVSDEKFMNQANNWLNLLKLRLSYGVNGNQDVGRYGSFARARTRNMVFGDQSYVTISPQNLGNADLTWETTTSFNLGFDFGFMDNRLSGSIDVYDSKTEDVLVSRNLPTITGFNSILQNIGEINNKGIEFSLNSINVKTKEFQWTSNLNFSLNRNKITKLYGGENDFDLGNRWFTGEPINVFYDWNNLGVVWSEEEFFNGETPEGFFPGYFKVEDIITPEGNDQYDPDDDRKILGTPDPNYRVSFQNNFNYKGFNLSIFINSIQGGNGYYLGNGSDYLITGGTDIERRKNRPAIRPYWRPDAPTTNSPGMFWPQSQTGPLLVDRSFIRLQDITLSYNLPQTTLKKIGVKNLQFYMSGKNLVTWTKWPGWDPEVGNSISPIMRTYIFGIKTSF
ncbi:TonB-dependent receptor [Gaetbulibacter sp. M240]|uniref:SusC/RagA family TonB-linked outer membrane protein n=1 Tax=Gaetbulibacter sp. M240 TaxID=3126511 RepID=UPI00374E6F19